MYSCHAVFNQNKQKMLMTRLLQLMRMMLIFMKMRLEFINSFTYKRMTRISVVVFKENIITSCCFIPSKISKLIMITKMALIKNL